MSEILLAACGQWVELGEGFKSADRGTRQAVEIARDSRDKALSGVAGPEPFSSLHPPHAAQELVHSQLHTFGLK